MFPELWSSGKAIIPELQHSGRLGFPEASLNSGFRGSLAFLNAIVRQGYLSIREREARWGSGRTFHNFILTNTNRYKQTLL